MAIASAILFFIYLAVLVIMGMKMAKDVDSMESYWMANRSLPAYRIGFCLAASWFGLSSFTGQAGWLYGEGLGALFHLAIPNFAAIFLIGVIFVKKIRKIPAISQPEFLEMRYSAAIRPWLAIIIMISFAGYAAMEFIALQYVFDQFMGWPPVLGAILIVVITLIYVNLGGMNTVVWTEVVQYCLLFLVGAIVAIGAIVKGTAMINAGEVAGIAAGTSIFSVPHLESDASWWSIMSLGLGMTVILIVSMWPGWSTEQSPWQRIWMARDNKSAFRGAMIGTGMNAIVYVFTILMAVGAWVILGTPASQGADFNSELIVYELMKQVLPTWIIPIIIVGFMAAAMSNISNFATSAASNIAKDLYQRYLRPHATQREMVWASRGCIALALILGVIFGMAIPSILDAVFMAASLATCGYVVPIVGALYWRRGNTKGALASIILGGGGYLIMGCGQLFGGWVFPLDPVIICLAVSIVAYIAVSLATAPPKTTQLVGFFERDAEEFINTWKQAGFAAEPSAEAKAIIDRQMTEKKQGDRYLLMMNYSMPDSNFATVEAWESYIQKLLNNKSWAWLAGYDVLYKITEKDMLSNVRLARGKDVKDIMIYCEPIEETLASVRKAMAVAVDDLLLAEKA